MVVLALGVLAALDRLVAAERPAPAARVTARTPSRPGGPHPSTRRSPPRSTPRASAPTLHARRDPSYCPCPFSPHYRTTPRARGSSESMSGMRRHVRGPGALLIDDMSAPAVQRRTGVQLPGQPASPRHDHDQHHRAEARITTPAWSPPCRRHPGAENGVVATLPLAVDRHFQGGRHPPSGSRPPVPRWSPPCRRHPGAEVGVVATLPLAVDRQFQGGRHLAAGIRVPRTGWSPPSLWQSTASFGVVATLLPASGCRERGGRHPRSGS